MSTPNPIELANIFGLSPGLDGEAAKILVKEESQRADKILTPFNDLPSDSQTPFWAELAATYLPSLLRTYFNNTFTAFDPTYHLSWGMLQTALHQAILHGDILFFARFAQQHPDECLSFHNVLRRRLCEMADVKLSALQANEILLQTFTSTMDILACLAHFSYRALPLSLLPLALRPQEKEKLRRLHARVDAVKSKVLVSLIVENAAVALVLLDAFIRLNSLQLWKTVSEKGQSRTSKRLSETCEATQVVSSPYPSPCVSLPEGEEMMVCGRCMAVRYCSTAHQKFHWKTHKMCCFKPNW